VDLVECIDWQSVECLNEKSTHTFVNALKQAIFLVDSHLISVTASLSLVRSLVKICSNSVDVNPIIVDITQNHYRKAELARNYKEKCCFSLLDSNSKSNSFHICKYSNDCKF